MNQARIEIRDTAIDQIHSAASWFLGSRLVKSFEDCFQQISRFPRMNPILHRDIRRAFTRIFPYKVYYILPDETSALILAVRHQSQDDRSFIEKTPT